jgi:large subunit ribosomal protein L28
MSRICQVTGKKPSVGNQRSHSNRATKRRFLPNLFTKIVINPFTQEAARVRLSAHGLRCLTKSPAKYWKKLVENLK